MNDNFCVFLDAGHGGLNKSGRYVTAPSKMFKHSRGEFHGDGYFYEGVWNRRITREIADKLKQLGIPHLIVSHEYLDYSLQYRADTANWYYQNFKKGVFISNHSNASGGNARGFEVYTTPGTTASDTLAEMLWEEVTGLLSETIRLRSDTSDNDHDKEARFYVLRKTVMPAILVENLFFDNYDDATLLMSDYVTDMLAEAQVRAIIRFMNRG